MVPQARLGWNHLFGHCQCPHRVIRSLFMSPQKDHRTTAICFFYDCRRLIIWFAKFSLFVCFWPLVQRSNSSFLIPETEIRFQQPTSREWDTSQWKLSGRGLQPLRDGRPETTSRRSEERIIEQFTRVGSFCSSQSASFWNFKYHIKTQSIWKHIPTVLDQSVPSTVFLETAGNSLCPSTVNSGEHVSCASESHLNRFSRQRLC